MLSPGNIKNHEFNRGIGYSKRSVDEFISEIAKEYEELFNENADLKEKITVLSEGLQYYKSMEKTLQKALVLAQKVSDEQQAEAAKKAGIIEKNARTKAEEVLSKAKSDLDLIYRQTDELNRRFELYKAHVRNLVNTQLDFINSDAYQISVNDLEGYFKLDNTIEDTKVIEPEEANKNSADNDKDDIIKNTVDNKDDTAENAAKKVQAEPVATDRVVSKENEKAGEASNTDSTQVENGLKEEVKPFKEQTASKPENLISRIPNETVRREMQPPKPQPVDVGEKVVGNTLESQNDTIKNQNQAAAEEKVNINLEVPENGVWNSEGKDE